MDVPEDRINGDRINGSSPGWLRDLRRRTPEERGKNIQILPVCPRHLGSMVFIFSKKITAHPQNTPRAVPLTNYERNPFIACW